MDPFGLAKVLVLAEVVPMVGGKDDDGVVGDSEHVELVEQHADPAVDHGDLAAVGGVCGLDVLFAEPGITPFRIGRIQRGAFEIGLVQLDVVIGWVPGLVRVPGVDVKEERPVVMALEPVIGGAHRPGDEAIAL